MTKNVIQNLRAVYRTTAEPGTKKMGSKMPGRGKEEVCLVLATEKLFAKVREKLKKRFALEHISSIEKAVDTIRQFRVLCLIAKVNEKTGFTPKQLSDFIKQFPNIPAIAIVDKNKIDLAFNCGKAGVDDLLPVSELEKLQDKLFRVLSLRQMQSVQELDFDITNCSRRVKRVIEFIETHFTKIQFIKEIAFIFGVNIATLSREFSKETGIHIKKLLNFNKVRYAAYLMKYSELSLNEICTWAGFSNRFVFFRNFRKFMDLTPGEYRKMNRSIDFKQIFQQKVKK